MVIRSSIRTPRYASSRFNTKGFAYAVIAVFVVFEALDFLIHGFILSGTYESLNETGLWREDMESKMWIMYVTAFFFSVIFVYLFHFFSKGHFASGLKLGFCYGLLTGLLMLVVGMFNQYAVYNVPLDLTWQWFLYGMAQMIIVGIVTAMIYKPLEQG